MVTEPRIRPINEAICSYTVPDTVNLVTLLHPQAFPMTCETCGLQTWARVKAEARQQNSKREAKPKKHYSPKRAVNFLLCDFTRDKIGKREVEWRNTDRRRTEDSSYIRLPQHHLSAQLTVPPGSPGCTSLAAHGEKQEHHQPNLFQMSAYKWLPFCSDRVWLAYSDIKNSVQMSELN